MLPWLLPLNVSACAPPPSHPQLPRSLENRPLEWDLDEEVGRQAVAGMNPCTLTALKQLPEALGSAIRNQHVVGETMHQLVNIHFSRGLDCYFEQQWVLALRKHLSVP